MAFGKLSWVESPSAAFSKFHIQLIFSCVKKFECGATKASDSMSNVRLSRSRTEEVQFILRALFTGFGGVSFFILCSHVNGLIYNRILEEQLMLEHLGLENSWLLTNCLRSKNSKLGSNSGTRSEEEFMALNQKAWAIWRPDWRQHGSKFLWSKWVASLTTRYGGSSCLSLKRIAGTHCYWTEHSAICVLWWTDNSKSTP